ncbi:interferon-gamma-inducible GTPase 10-like [Heterodontus francisci]|uniref:interferon-gamma-inducible GTPase 10-like n=1 Tax=Heterodontus francisci TaxID=7792 RepID=UPI00355B97A0
MVQQQRDLRMHVYKSLKVARQVEKAIEKAYGMLGFVNRSIQKQGIMLKLYKSLNYRPERNWYTACSSDSAHFVPIAHLFTQHTGMLNHSRAFTLSSKSAFPKYITSHCSGLNSICYRSTHVTSPVISFIINHIANFCIVGKLLNHTSYIEIQIIDVSHKRDPMIVSSTFFNMEELEQLKTSYNTGGLEAVIPEMKNKLDDLDNAQLNIAVTGEIGSGKSTFITAMIGLEISEEERVGNEETNKEPVVYPHPTLPNVQFWELPGICSSNLQWSDYLKIVNVERYDMFLIMSDCRFKGNDGEFAKVIQQGDKQFYFVQSKTDNQLPPLEMEGAAFNDELQKLRMDCVSNLEGAGITAPAVFLISSFHQNKYDFPVLKDTLANNLQNRKKIAFLRALPNVTSKIIEQKRKMLEKRIWMTAALAGAVGAVPVPGLSFATGIGLLVAGLMYLWHHLDLRDKCLQRLAATAGKPLTVLQTEIQSPGKISRAFIRILLCITAVACTIAEVKLGFTPMIVSVFGAVSSFSFTAMLLKDSLNEHVKTTQRAVKSAFETS